MDVSICSQLVLSVGRERLTSDSDDDDRRKRGTVAFSIILNELRAGRRKVSELRTDEAASLLQSFCLTLSSSVTDDDELGTLVPTYILVAF